MSERFKELRVYQRAYGLAMELFHLTRSFPREEKYALTDQIRRSSRSVCSNLAEAYRKRQYPKHFISKLSDADCEASETIVWIDFAKDCQYIDDSTHQALLTGYREVGKMLGRMIKEPGRFSV